MSAPEENDDPSPPAIPAATPALKPALVEDQDEVFATMLGPTLKQLQQKAAEGTLTRPYIADYLALVQALSETHNEVPVEYLGTRPLEIAGEALEIIATKLVSPRVWQKKQNDSQKAVTDERDEKLRAMANALYRDPAIDARTIAKAFLKDSNPVLRDDLLLVPDPAGGIKLMAEDTLRKIIAKRGEK